MRNCGCVCAHTRARSHATDSQPDIRAVCVRGTSASLCSPFPSAKHALRKGERRAKNASEPNSLPAFRNRPPTHARQECVPGTRRVVSARCTFENVRNRLFAKRSLNILRPSPFSMSVVQMHAVRRSLSPIRWRDDPPPLCIPDCPSFCSGYDEADRCALQTKIGRA